jgi:hypothetical protein
MACASRSDALVSSLPSGCLIVGWRRIDAEFGTEELELMAFDVVDRHSAPALGSLDHRGDGELHGCLLAHERRNDLGPPAPLLKTPLSKVGRPHPDAVKMAPVSDRNLSACSQDALGEVESFRVDERWMREALLDVDVRVSSC